MSNYSSFPSNYNTKQYSSSYFTNQSINQYSSSYFNNQSINQYRNIEKPASLRNKGANCYLNAGFQAISACTEFTKEMEQLLSKYPNCEKLNTFNKLIKELQNPDATKSFLEISNNRIFQNWNKSGQQDSFELLTHVINEIYDEIKTKNGISKKKLTESLELQLPMRILFKNKIKCCKESPVHENTQCDLAFHIPIPNKEKSSSIMLKDLIEMFFNKEIIEDYSCDKCDSTKATKQTKLCLPFPNTICIHLQRLYWDNEKMFKIEEKVEFDKEIIMKKSFFRGSTMETSSPFIEDHKYYLKSVIVHYGDASFGHYICYKLFKDSWFLTDDFMIMKEDIEKILNCQAYILFYENVKDIQDINNDKNSSDSQKCTNETIEKDRINTNIKGRASSCHNVDTLTKDFSDLQITDNKRLNYGSFIDKVPESQVFELSQFECILIEALSSCSSFVYELKKINRKHKSEKIIKIINLILKQNSPFNYKSSTNKNIDFEYNNLETMLISIFNSGLNRNTDIQTIRDSFIETYPFKISFQFECKCRKSIECLDPEVSLFFESYCYNLQDAIDNFFEKNYFSLGRTNYLNGCCSYRNIKLKSIPNLICVYIKGGPTLLKISSIKDITIKKKYFSSLYNDNYKYYLKSVISNGSECYRLYGNEWYHISNKEIKKIDSVSYLECRIMFFEQIPGSKKVEFLTNKDIEFLRSHKCSNSYSEICSIGLRRNENNIYPKESNKISSVISDNIYYLKIALHALSSCKSFSKEIVEIIGCNLEYSDQFSTQMELIDERIEDHSLLEEIINKLHFDYEINLFQLLSKLLSYILNNSPKNPFLISKRKTVKCLNCDSILSEHEDMKMSFDIPVITKFEKINLENYIKQSFAIQNLDGFNCTKNECSSNKSKIISKLCDPIPKIIFFHVENLIWNVKVNEFKYADVHFQEVLTLQPEIFENHLKKDSFIYHLQSILVYNNYKKEYSCYKKFSDDWYKINRSSRCKTSIYKVSKWEPHILFYEGFD